MEQKRDFNFTIQWHLTEKCPNHCKHCYMYDNQPLIEPLYFEQQLQLLDQLKKFEEKYQVEIKNFFLTGGDPFCHPNFETLLNELSKRGKKISILGIPERLTDKNVEMLESYGVFGYQVSLDGMPDKHDAIRGKGSFYRTIAAIKKYTHSLLALSVMYTLSKDNVDDFFELITFLDKEKIHVGFSFDFLVFQGNALEQKDQVFTATEIHQLLDRYIETKNRLETQGSLLHLREKPKLFSAYRQSMHKADNNSSPLSAPTLFSVCDGCYNGICSVSILPNGDVYPCRRLPIKVGNLLTESFEDILLGNELMRKFRRKDSYEKCGKCNYYFLCRGCSAVTYSLCGDPFAPYPYCFLESCDTERTNVCDVFTLPPIKESSNQAEFIYILNSYQNVCLNATEKGNLLRIFKATEEGGWR